MNFDIKKIGEYDITGIRDKVLSFTESDWVKQTFRQDTYKEHNNTQSILLIHDNFENYKKLVDHDIAAMFTKEIDELTDILTSVFDKGQLRDVTFVRLSPNSSVLPHIDNISENLKGWQRCHLPIITDEKVIFNVGDTTMHLEEGSIYQIDNTNKIHSVLNDSDTPRVHLLLEYFIEE